MECTRARSASRCSCSLTMYMITRYFRRGANCLVQRRRLHHLSAGPWAVLQRASCPSRSRTRWPFSPFSCQRPGRIRFSCDACSTARWATAAGLDVFAGAKSREEDASFLNDDGRGWHNRWRLRTWRRAASHPPTHSPAHPQPPDATTSAVSKDAPFSPRASPVAFGLFFQA